MANVDGDAEPRLSLLERIGEFLEAQRLGPEPLNYEFAYRVLSNPGGALARAVRELTDGGVRLTRKDIVGLGGEIAAPEPDLQQRELHDVLVAQTQMQVEGFHDLVRNVHAETTGFGEHLAASADALRLASVDRDDELVRLTSAMIERVRTTEKRLEAATREAAELREKLDEARDKARRDPLTGLPNRRAFEDAYQTHLAAGTPMCIAVCDIDKFKLVNDSFGHAVGDRVLQAIGQVIQAECGTHIVARYGGEEFAVLFADLPLDKAQQCLEAARTSVGNKRYRLRESDAPLGSVTFSAGLTIARPGEPLDASFPRADALLYEAKNSGRNRLHVG